jgi:hypothetical protein
LASRSSTKKSKHRKKKQPLELNALEGKKVWRVGRKSVALIAFCLLVCVEKPGSLKHIYLERERKLRESDKLEMQMVNMGRGGVCVILTMMSYDRSPQAMKSIK